MQSQQYFSQNQNSHRQGPQGETLHRCWCPGNPTGVIRITKKEGPNCGRSFLACATGAERGGCKFFKWLDPAGPHVATAHTGPSRGGDNVVDFSQPGQGYQAYGSGGGTGGSDQASSGYAFPRGQQGLSEAGQVFHGQSQFAPSYVRPQGVQGQGDGTNQSGQRDHTVHAYGQPGTAGVPVQLVGQHGPEPGFQQVDQPGPASVGGQGESGTTAQSSYIDEKIDALKQEISDLHKSIEKLLVATHNSDCLLMEILNYTEAKAMKRAERENENAIASGLKDREKSGSDDADDDGTDNEGRELSHKPTFIVSSSSGSRKRTKTDK